MPEGPRGGPRPLANSSIEIKLVPPEDQELAPLKDADESIRNTLKDTFGIGDDATVTETFFMEIDEFGVSIILEGDYTYDLMNDIFEYLNNHFRIDGSRSFITTT